MQLVFQIFVNTAFCRYSDIVSFALAGDRSTDNSQMSLALCLVLMERAVLTCVSPYSSDASFHYDECKVQYFELVSVSAVAVKKKKKLALRARFTFSASVAVRTM